MPLLDPIIYPLDLRQHRLELTTTTRQRCKKSEDPETKPIKARADAPPAAVHRSPVCLRLHSCAAPDCTLHTDTRTGSRPQQPRPDQYIRTYPLPLPSGRDCPWQERVRDRHRETSTLAGLLAFCTTGLLTYPAISFSPLARSLPAYTSTRDS